MSAPDAGSASPRADSGVVAIALVAVLLVGGALLVAPPRAVPPGIPATVSPSVSAGVNSSWTNVTAGVGIAPEGRSLTQAAYSPARGAVILFGGYNGAGGNFALGDTWQFAGQRWTELSAAGGPSPRWGGAMVYDPATRSLILFGGRNVTAFFNDTWSYNATGWHRLSTPVAPTPRYDFGFVYDPALGAIVLYGGARGNVPAGTFSDFVFFNDTWTFANGIWTNITSSAGPAPVGRLVRGQMAYDAADGYIVLVGGYEYAPLGGTCGLATFSTAFGETWTFWREGGGWSQIVPNGRVPPPGIGAVWYDTGANLTLYYEGLQLGSSGSCGTSGNEVWSYGAGNWTLVTEGNISAPAPRFLPMFLDDPTERAQLEFGGEYATGTEYAAGYGNDTWLYQPTWVTIRATGLPTGAELEVRLLGQVIDSPRASLLLVEGPGDYAFHFTAIRGTASVAEVGSGSFDLGDHPTVVPVVLTPLSVPPSSTPGAGELPLGAIYEIAAGVAVGAAIGAGVVGAVAAGARRQLRREGELLVEAMTPSTDLIPPRSRP